MPFRYKCTFSQGKKNQVLRELIRQKQDKDGVIVENKRGQPKTFVPVMVAEKESSAATPNTIRKRSSERERLECMTCAPSNEKNDISFQRASAISWDRDWYIAAAQTAGVKILHKIKLDTVAALKCWMPWDLFKMLKRTFTTEFGVDSFGTEKDIGTELKQYQHEFECGSFETVDKESKTKPQTFSESQILRRCQKPLSSPCQKRSKLLTIPTFQLLISGSW